MKFSISRSARLIAGLAFGAAGLTASAGAHAGSNPWTVTLYAPGMDVTLGSHMPVVVTPARHRGHTPVYPAVVHAPNHGTVFHRPVIHAPVIHAPAIRPPVYVRPAPVFVHSPAVIHHPPTVAIGGGHGYYGHGYYGHGYYEHGASHRDARGRGHGHGNRWNDGDRHDDHRGAPHDRRHRGGHQGYSSEVPEYLRY